MELRFRPLSGYLISKSWTHIVFILVSRVGFRPLSGYLISKWIWVSGNTYECKFPSPLGVSYFQISKEFFFRNLFHNVFPSPLGVSYFQISLKVCKRCLLLLKKFPSPLGVSYFQIGWRKSMTRKEKVMGFRPLSGYLISKYVLV